MKRALYYAVVILLAFLLQHNLLTAGSIMGNSPNLLLIVTCAAGFLQGKQEGLWVGLCCGLLKDFILSDTIGFYSLIYVYLGYLCGILQKYVNSEFLTFPLAVCGIGDFLYQFYIFFLKFVLRNRMNFPFYFRSIMMPEIVYTVVVALVLYQLLRIGNEKLCQLEKRRAKEFV